MNDLLPLLFFFVLLAAWTFIAWRVGLVAKGKGRRRSLWVLLSIFPLGPIMAPFWLASMPVVGDEASKKQIAGRAVLITLVIFSLVSGIFDAAVRQKAKAEFGIESEDVVNHYKQMNVDEIVTCLQLNNALEEVEQGDVSDDESNNYQFETQREVEIYNRISTLGHDLECDTRTYTYLDLNRAMELVKQQVGESAVSSVIAKIGGNRSIIESVVSHKNTAAPGMVDKTTRYDGMELGQGNEIIVRFTLVEYSGAEVKQADLEYVYQPLLEAGSCSDPDLSYFRNSNFLLKYEYSGHDGKSIGAIDISGACKD